MQFRSLYLLIFYFTTSQNRLICYNNDDIGILLDDNYAHLVLPWTFTLVNTEQIYSSDYLPLSNNSVSYLLSRSKFCRSLLAVNYKGPKGNIQINTFDIKGGESGPIITQFKLETRDDTRELKVELENIDSNIKMFINIIDQGSSQKIEQNINYPDGNYYSEINETYVNECVFIKVKKISFLINIPVLRTWLIANTNSMVRWLITWEYKYRDQILTEGMDFYATTAYCIFDQIGFDFILKHQPYNVKIKISASDNQARSVFDIEFIHENNKTDIKYGSKTKNLGFEPQVIDINKAVVKKTKIPNFVLENFEVWGYCKSSTHKIVNIEIYQRFGFKYFHYGMYPFPHPKNANIMIWKSLSHNELEEKVKNQEIFCHQNA